MARYKKNKKDKEDKDFLSSVPHLGLSAETKRGVAVVVFCVLGLVTLLSAVNLAGSLGESLLGLLKWLVGALGYFVPFLFFFVAILLARHKLSDNKKEGSEDGKKASEHEKGFYWRIYLGALLFIGSVAGLIDIFYLTNGDTAFNFAN